MGEQPNHLAPHWEQIGDERYPVQQYEPPGGLDPLALLGTRFGFRPQIASGVVGPWSRNPNVLEEFMARRKPSGHQEATRRLRAAIDDSGMDAQARAAWEAGTHDPGLFRSLPRRSQPSPWTDPAMWLSALGYGALGFYGGGRVKNAIEERALMRRANEYGQAGY